MFSTLWVLRKPAGTAVLFLRKISNRHRVVKKHVTEYKEDIDPSLKRQVSSLWMMLTCLDLSGV